MNVTATPSPNFNERKHDVDMIVLHYTGMETGDAALSRMCDQAAEVSAHYMVRENGEIVQLVGEDKRAWHAGVSAWQGDGDLNSRSIGIEIVNGGHDVPLSDGSLPPFPDVQITAVIALCQQIMQRWPILQTRIVAHSDIAPARKRDPGEHFPWARLAAHGIGLWPMDLSEKEQVQPSGITETRVLPGDTGAPVRQLQEQLAHIGYGVAVNGVFDEQTKDALTAFQRRWLPRHLGRHGDLETIATVSKVYDLYQATAKPSA